MNDYYVYVHRRRTTGEPFYYGKGRDRRAWEPYRNAEHSKVRDECGIVVEILSSGLTDDQAKAAEIWLIAGAREVGEDIVNISNGGDGVAFEVLSRVGKKTYELRIGIHAPEHLGKGGHIGGTRSKQNQSGIFSPTYDRTKGGRASAAIRYTCLECGLVASAGNMAQHQKWKKHNGVSK